MSVAKLANASFCRSCQYGTNCVRRIFLDRRDHEDLAQGERHPLAKLILAMNRVREETGLHLAESEADRAGIRIGRNGRVELFVEVPLQPGLLDVRNGRGIRTKGGLIEETEATLAVTLSGPVGGDPTVKEAQFSDVSKPGSGLVTRT